MNKIVVVCVNCEMAQRTAAKFFIRIDSYVESVHFHKSRSSIKTIKTILFTSVEVYASFAARQSHYCTRLFCSFSCILLFNINS